MSEEPNDRGSDWGVRCGGGGEDSEGEREKTFKSDKGRSETLRFQKKGAHPVPEAQRPRGKSGKRCF